MEQTLTRWSTRDMAYIAVFVAVMAVCSWISIPTAIPFTLAAYPAYSFHPVLAANRANLTLAPLLYEGLFLEE